MLMLLIEKTKARKKRGFPNYHNQTWIQTKFKTTRILGKLSLKVLHTTLLIGLMMFSTLLIQQINKFDPCKRVDDGEIQSFKPPLRSQQQEPSIFFSFQALTGSRDDD